VVIEGVKLALDAFPDITELHLVGNKLEVERALARIGCHDPRLRLHHASEVLTMEDKPLSALRRKKDASIVRAMDLLKAGKAQVVISTGNTGGIVAAATLKLRRLEGIDRPALAPIMPGSKNGSVLIDGGANPDCKAAHLAQFAIMGNIYAREILGYKRPRVGILSNGTEDFKGNDLTRDAAKLCQQLDLHFIGYVEGHDLFSDRVEVVVTDGFIGNVVLKSCESLANWIVHLLRSELAANPIRKFGAAVACRALQNIKHRMDPEVYGGAPLLGLNGTVIKAHGSARENAIMNAIRVATQAVQHRLNDLICREIAAAGRVVAKITDAVPAAA
jgi:glycerol-3-phosphate acyltransferase PlsX